MALSKEARRAYQKALKEQEKRRRKSRHWLLITKDDSVREIISKVFTQICCMVFAVCIVILFFYFKAILDNTSLNSELQSLYSSVTEFVSQDGEVMPSAQALLDVNPDTVGWIKIEDTKVDLPVVQRKESDGNEYYLKHNFENGNAKAGTVFLDYRASLGFKKQSDNLVVYGHNEADNSMFGDLDRYKHDLEFYKAHPVVTFNSNYETAQYKIVGFFVTTVLPEQSRDGTVFDYHNYIDMDKNKYNDFISNVMDRTQVNTNVDVMYGDKFLTLSTCSNEFEPSRFVIVARKVRDGEEATVDTSAATLNTGALEPDFSYIYSR